MATPTEKEKSTRKEVTAFGGFVHDLVNHVTAATLSMNYMEQRLTKDSEMLRDYALQSAKTRKSIEQFARSARVYMKKGRAHSRINLRKEIEMAIEPFRFSAKTSDIEIKIRPGENIFIYGNKFKFQQIISNLVSNALYACRSCEKNIENVRKSKKQRVETRRSRNVEILYEQGSEAHVKIVVRDNGCGIPKEIMGRIFEPFFTTKDRQGSGLGLATVKKIVEEDFGGTMQARMRTSGGASFTLLLQRSLNRN